MARPVSPNRHYDLLGRAIRKAARDGKEDLAKQFQAMLSAMRKSKTVYSKKAWEILNGLPKDAQERIFDTRDVLQTKFAAE